RFGQPERPRWLALVRMGAGEDIASGREPISPGAVRLTVSDLDGVRAFYEGALGLVKVGGSPEVTRLGAGSTALVELVSSPDATQRPRRTTGLFHVAILVPSRPDLARSLNRVVQA